MSRKSPKSLPQHPSEEHLRKQAKRLARGASIKLGAAQLEVANEYGYRTWAELIRTVRSTASAREAASNDDTSKLSDSLSSDKGSSQIFFPLLPLRGLVAFPQVAYPIFIGRQASMNAVRRAQEKASPIILVAQKDAVTSNPSGDDMYEVGAFGSVVELESLPDGTIRSVIETKQRARISRFIFDQDCSMAEASMLEEPNEPDRRLDNLVSSVTTTFAKARIDKAVELVPWSPEPTTLDRASVVADRIASRLPLKLALKQALLETLSPEERLTKIISFLNTLELEGEARTTEDSGAARKRYANSIRKEVHLRSGRLVRALAEVPREKYLGPGPWKILRPSNLGEYVVTPDDNPVRVYDNVLVALDPARHLNNGLPSVVSSWIDALDLHEDERVVHAGCGTGYYTALMARVVGKRGRVTGIEYDRELAAQARKNLAALPWVEVVCANACDYDAGEADAILINAGATRPVPLWLDSLARNSRLVFSMTRSSASSGPIGFGVTVLVHRAGPSYEARLLSPVGLYACVGASDADSERLLGRALDAGSFAEIRSLRRDLHDADESCALHGKGYCFSKRRIS
jgi:protein-L-isoaspartate(D-aspartate) O-methyltransferase